LPRGRYLSDASVEAGLQRAIAKGKTLGRPRIDPAIERKARKMLKDGVGMLRIAAELDIGSGTVQRIAREMRN
jgi:DNA invertase Pin-like site-specific DNA recombinase